jgi:hypothetical protein
MVSKIVVYLGQKGGGGGNGMKKEELTHGVFSLLCVCLLLSDKFIYCVTS